MAKSGKPLLAAYAERPEALARVFTVHAGILRDSGLALAPDAKVLDFGCGAGENVYEYRDHGVEAYGFDVKDEAALRNPEERSWFPLAGPDGKIPFADGFFDFVFSTWVLEHVQDHVTAFSEIARVLKPGGISIHYFPSRYRPVEPHIYVPLAGLFQSRSYLHLWARLGIRNEFQQGMTADQVANLNADYLATQTKYLSKRRLRAAASPYFSKVEFVEDRFVRHWPGMAGKAAPVLNVVPPLRAVVSTLHTRVMLLIR